MVSVTIKKPKLHEICANYVICNVMYNTIFRINPLNTFQWGKMIYTYLVVKTIFFAVNFVNHLFYYLHIFCVFGFLKHAILYIQVYEDSLVYKRKFEELAMHNIKMQLIKENINV